MTEAEAIEIVRKYEMLVIAAVRPLVHPNETDDSILTNHRLTAPEGCLVMLDHEIDGMYGSDWIVAVPTCSRPDFVAALKSLPAGGKRARRQ